MLKVYSGTLGVGTSVKIYLPRHYGEAAATEQAKSPRQHSARFARRDRSRCRGRRARVRALSVEALKELGYSVVEAFWSGASVGRMLDEGQRVNLLFTGRGHARHVRETTGRSRAGEMAKAQSALHDGLYAQTPSYITGCSIQAPTS